MMMMLMMMMMGNTYYAQLNLPHGTYQKLKEYLERKVSKTENC